MVKKSGFELRGCTADMHFTFSLEGDEVSLSLAGHDGQPVRHSFGSVTGLERNTAHRLCYGTGYTSLVVQGDGDSLHLSFRSAHEGETIAAFSVWGGLVQHRPEKVTRHDPIVFSA